MPDWAKYYQVTKDKPPDPLLVRAVGLCERKEMALDLGAGALRDTKFLLEQGFEVVAVDNSSLMLEAAKGIASDRLRTVQSAFDQYDFPAQQFDLVNARYALPFNEPTTFTQMFEKLKKSLRSGGVFVGQFFGKHDSWNVPGKPMTFYDRNEVKRLLAGLEIIEFREKDEDGETAVGESKHWHVFDVIAKVPNG